MRNDVDCSWLDPIIEKQKCNTDIMETISSPYSAPELQELVEQGEI